MEIAPALFNEDWRRELASSLYLTRTGALTLFNEDGHMPKVGSTHYAYTAAGKKAAAAARKAGKGMS